MVNHRMAVCCAWRSIQRSQIVQIKAIECRCDVECVMSIELRTVVNSLTRGCHPFCIGMTFSSSVSCLMVRGRHFHIDLLVCLWLTLSSSHFVVVVAAVPVWKVR